MQKADLSQDSSALEAGNLGLLRRLYQMLKANLKDGRYALETGDWNQARRLYADFAGQAEADISLAFMELQVPLSALLGKRTSKNIVKIIFIKLSRRLRLSSDEKRAEEYEEAERAFADKAMELAGFLNRSGSLHYGFLSIFVPQVLLCLKPLVESSRKVSMPYDEVLDLKPALAVLFAARNIAVNFCASQTQGYGQAQNQVQAQAQNQVQAQAHNQAQEQPLPKRELRGLCLEAMRLHDFARKFVPVDTALEKRAEDIGKFHGEEAAQEFMDRWMPLLSQCFDEKYNLTDGDALRCLASGRKGAAEKGVASMADDTLKQARQCFKAKDFEKAGKLYGELERYPDTKDEAGAALRIIALRSSIKAYEWEQETKQAKKFLKDKKRTGALPGAGAGNVADKVKEVQLAARELDDFLNTCNVYEPGFIEAFEPWLTTLLYASDKPWQV